MIRGADSADQLVVFGEAQSLLGGLLDAVHREPQDRRGHERGHDGDEDDDRVGLGR